MAKPFKNLNPPQNNILVPPSPGYGCVASVRDGTGNALELYVVMLEDMVMSRSCISVILGKILNSGGERALEEAIMERNSVACAMAWSIELEKALRTKKPGVTVETILKTGSRLEHWSREPEPTMAVYKMFDLVPGEDRLFANTILLRLADAFRLGDKQTKHAVVKIFLSEYRHRDKNTKSKGRNGIFSKVSKQNYLELLARVKVVFDTDDVESRALALVLFGCWAEFAKDSAQIRYLILSTLVSSHVLELKASLFAAGCFSELSDDFASVLLEMLVNLVTSSETSSTVKLAVARVFAKIGCSYSVANKAYKTGLKLMLDSSDKDFLIALLVSLSKLASKSTVLISEQVDVLFSFLRREKRLPMKATVLRCLHFLAIKGLYRFPISADLVNALLITVNEPELPRSTQYEALQILHKILSYMLPCHLPSLDMPEFSKLLTITESSSQSAIMSKSFLSIRVLVDLSTKLTGRMEMESSMFCSSSLPSRLILLIINQMKFLVNDVCQVNSRVFQEVHGLLNLLAALVGEHPDLGVLVLDKVSLFVEFVASMHDHVMDTSQSDKLVLEMDFKKEKSIAIKSKLALLVYRFLVVCLESLSEAGLLTSIAFERVKLLVVRVCGCTLFDCYTHTIYSLLFHSQIFWGFLVDTSEVTCSVNESSTNYCLVEKEILTLEPAKKMLKERHNWPAYKAGAYAASQGAWYTVAFIFEQLITKVQSDIFYCWLKSIIQLAHSEKRIQLLLLPKQGSTLVDWLENNRSPASNEFGEISRDTVGNGSEPNYSEKLLEAYESICSSGKTLEAAVTLDQEFCFQRWFLHLRAKLLRALLDMFTILKEIALNPDGISNNAELEKSVSVECLKSLPEIIQISLRFKMLAQEFDLVATSFIDMDRKSSKVISLLALSCSLLAFSTGYVLFLPNVPAYETLMTCDSRNLKNCLQAMLIQNLAVRLCHIDHETSRNLCQLFDISGQVKNCFHLLIRNENSKVGSEGQDILTVCSYAALEAVRLKEANKGHDEEVITQVTKGGLQALLHIIRKWIHIPFQVPKYFFKVRRCLGSELFACNSDTKSPDGITVSSGLCLSLNLCLQLVNLPPDLPARLTKLCCILYCRMSFQEPGPIEEDREQEKQGFRAWETDDMVEINEMLFHHVTNLCTKGCNSSKRRRFDKNKDGIVCAFAHFEPNESGQGFGSCLLDISGFPVGSYRIKWRSCFLDNQGSYWTLIPFNAGPVVTVQRSPAGR